jgi:hypothetical protein
MGGSVSVSMTENAIQSSAAAVAVGLSMCVGVLSLWNDGW